jgi:hypothetical protein
MYLIEIAALPSVARNDKQIIEFLFLSEISDFTDPFIYNPVLIKLEAEQLS